MKKKIPNPTRRRLPLYYKIFCEAQQNGKKTIASAEIADFIGVDSLEYLSLEGMIEAVNGGKNRFCSACFSGFYPTKVHKRMVKDPFS